MSLWIVCLIGLLDHPVEIELITPGLLRETGKQWSDILAIKKQTVGSTLLIFIYVTGDMLVRMSTNFG